MRRIIPALLGLSLLVTACGDDDADDDRSAVTSIPDTTTSSTTTTEARTVAPDVIPQDVALITEDYVEAVLNELYGVALDALVLAREAGLVDSPTIDLIEATSSSNIAPDRLNDLAALARSGFEAIKSEPRQIRLSVVDILETTPGCIIAEVSTDASELLVTPPEEPSGARDFVRLLVASPEQRSSGLNPTAWVLDEFPVTMDGSVAALECET